VLRERRGMEIDAGLAIDGAAVDRLLSSFGIALGSGQSKEEAIAPLATAIAEAAFEEYVLYLSGERVPAGVRDLRELRLRLLAEHLPGGLPRDAQVAALFHLTTSQARNLIAGTRARYPDEFETLFREAVKRALREAEPLEGDGARITAGRSLAAFIDDLLAESVTPPPTRLTDASGRFDLARETIDDLCSRLGMDRSEVGSQSS
jgi:hypothetical protein